MREFGKIIIISPLLIGSKQRGFNSIYRQSKFAFSFLSHLSFKTLLCVCVFTFLANATKHSKAPYPFQPLSQTEKECTFYSQNRQKLEQITNLEIFKTFSCIFFYSLLQHFTNIKNMIFLEG